MYELQHIELERLAKLTPALPTETDYPDRLEQAIRLHGAAPVLVNRETMRLMTGYEQLQTLAAMRAAGEQPPRGVDSDWRLSVVLGQWNADQEARAALRFEGGVNATLTTRPTVQAFLNVLFAYDDSSFHELDAIGLDIDEYLALLDTVASEPEQPPAPVPDLAPASWGVPTLDSRLQGEEIGQAVKWGSQARSTKTPGATIHFYTEDYKFSALVENPDALTVTECTSVVEPNFSTTPYTPRALALYQIYQRRALARQWQEAGIRVFVDLNIEREFFDLALLGVPSGWSAYANRSHGDLGHLEAAYELAQRHAAGQPVNYVVFGGGQRVRQLCEARGWHWIPEQALTARGYYGPE